MSYFSSCVVCDREPKNTYKNSALCGIHFRAAIRHETCAVCLDNMDRGAVTQLECGHIMHTQCLASCVAACCPLCRHGFGPEVGPKVQHETRVKPLVESIYALLEPVEVPRFFNLMINVSVCM